MTGGYTSDEGCQEERWIVLPQPQQKHPTHPSHSPVGLLLQTNPSVVMGAITISMLVINTINKGMVQWQEEERTALKQLFLLQHHGNTISSISR